MHWIRNSFAFDFRSIALFRIMLGTLILLDLVLRSRNMGAFYTDSGTLARRFWIDITHPWLWSFHAVSGELWWQVILFVLAGLIAICLALGYRSKMMAGLSFLLLASLQNRNGLLMQGGDLLLVVMCFWSLFLPLGARYSVDSALRSEHQHNPNAGSDDANPGEDDHGADDVDSQRYLSVATVAITLQILYLYFFTALLKTGDAWTSRFDAAYYAVSLQHFATPIGEWFRNFQGILKLSTIYVLAVEFIAPWLVLCPLLWPRIRLIGLVLLASLHAAFLLMLHIGLFPLIDFMALSLLIPGTVWVWFKRRRNPEQSQTVLHYDEDCGFCLKMCLILRAFLLPKNVVIQPAQKTASIYEIMQRENSWVVTDAGGQTFIHWHAMAFLFSQRWPFKPLGWLMSMPPFIQVGNWIYRWVANNRDLMGRITARYLPYRPLRLKPTIIGAVVAAAFFYVVTAFNIYEMPGLRGKMPHHVEYTARVLRLDQRWDMFAPFPATESSYPLISGNLRDETPVDLYQLTSSKADWRPPSRYYSLYPSYRWRKYLGRVRSHGNNSVRQALGDYYCRSWNGIERPRAEQLATLEIRFATIVTAPPGSAPNAEKRSMVWRHWCFPEYADKS
jgi:predicted DCC family thiol-disulfide oxidoreductase YuxK